MRRVEERPVSSAHRDVRGVLLGEIRLPLRPESAAAARRFLMAVSAAWGIPAAADTVELLGCELVTNAVRHAVAMPGSTLRLVTVRDGHRLRVKVHDPSAESPRPGVPALDDTSGRGLVLVEALSADAGWHPTAHGKAVWFEVVPEWPDGHG
jgi:anti-sigma regulatory factor (Ser/Thr protein kinase)